MDGCEFKIEHWARPDSPSCDSDDGVSFYKSATFDPAYGPEIRRLGTNATEASIWSGYAQVRDLVVFAANRDRALVEEVVDSARATPK